MNSELRGGKWQPAIPEPFWTSETVPLWKRLWYGEDSWLPQCYECKDIFKDNFDYQIHYSQFHQKSKKGTHE